MDSDPSYNLHSKSHLRDGLRVTTTVVLEKMPVLHCLLQTAVSLVLQRLLPFSVSQLLTGSENVSFEQRERRETEHFQLPLLILITPVFLFLKSNNSSFHKNIIAKENK